MAGTALRALFLAAAVAAVLASGGCGQDAQDAPATAREIAIHYSHFQPEEITVPAGVPITITLRNDDPIEHEWIIGTPEVHERHRTGTEPFHDTRPTEVTIPALSTRVTTITFDQPAELLYICHLPGHEAYGMAGTLRVVVSS
jgi:uncharacterized cupredoxin-like copper-binding protein